MLSGVSTSTSTYGNSLDFAVAAFRTSTPVGPLDGRLAQPANVKEAVSKRKTLRITLLRCDTRIVIDSKNPETV